MSDKPVDRDLMVRVNDGSDALTGQLDGARLATLITRPIAAADHLGAAAVGAKLARQSDDG